MRSCGKRRAKRSSEKSNVVLSGAKRSAQEDARLAVRGNTRSMLARATSAAGPLRGVAATRGFASKRAGGKLAKVKDVDLGWGKLREPLDAAPLRLASLTSLKILHASEGAGLAGARKFNKLMPALRWQNPDASIVQRWAEEDKKGAAVIVELADGHRSEFDVSGQRSEEILGRVLKAAGAPEADVAKSVQWAKEYLLRLESQRRGPQVAGLFDGSGAEGVDEGLHAEEDAAPNSDHGNADRVEKGRAATTP